MSGDDSAFLNPLRRRLGVPVKGEGQDFALHNEKGNIDHACDGLEFSQLLIRRKSKELSFREWTDEY